MGALGRGGIFVFEGFRLDRDAGALFRRYDDATFVPVAMGARALDVLGVLTERAGELVSRDEFMAAVWPATVVEDTNLNMQIATLRRVLDERRADGSCIQTIPGRGYRFAVPVTKVEDAASPASERLSGNGAGGPIVEPPAPPNPGAPRNTAIAVPPRERKWLWCGSLGLVAGTLCLLAVVVTASNWHPPQLGQARTAPRLSIVVLPFGNLSNDPDQQYFADGITEDLTTDLSRISDTIVISRNTAFTYRNKPVDGKQIGRDLGVRYVVEGSVRRSGRQLRVTAQLIDAATDAHLWAEGFDHDIGDLFALQNEITGRIVNTLSLELPGAEAARPTEHPDALDYILRGRAALSKPPSRENFVEQIGLFEQALALDPQSVEGQSRLAVALAGRVINGLTDSATADLARAEGLVGQALATSPRYALAHLVKATVLRAQNRCEEAIPEYETALALNHNTVYALIGLGWCKIDAGSPDEAIPLVEQAIRLSPRDPGIGWWYHQIGTVHLLQSRTDEAIVWLEKGRAAVPAVPVHHSRLASAYALRGETERAAAELAEARRLRGEGSYSSIARLKAGGWSSLPPKTRALLEATYFAGLRKAGVPEE
jgi:TolB-like protein/DNA-binding winged helix-turn-helix (wHTH) protein/Tfp pilus assembly protein PilF